MALRVDYHEHPTQDALDPYGRLLFYAWQRQKREGKDVTTFWWLVVLLLGCFWGGGAALLIGFWKGVL